jgi:hypothetical protein
VAYAASWFDAGNEAGHARAFRMGERIDGRLCPLPDPRAGTGMVDERKQCMVRRWLQLGEESDESVWIIPLQELPALPRAGISEVAHSPSH